SLHLYIESKKQEYYNFMQWIEKSPIASTLKRGHQELLKTALKEPGKVFTAKLVATEQDINENTARSYLKRLVDLDLLIESKSKHSKAIRYVAPANLKELLKI
ncbi:cell filamentation protein Fic, partial [Vibrio parahaemolyticus]